MALPDLPEFYVSTYGATGNGSTDDTASIQSAINAANSAGGGVVVFDSKRYLVSGNIDMPNDGATPPQMKPITLKGQGCFWTGHGNAVPAGTTVLDMRSTRADGKIVATGLGLFRIEGITFEDGTGASNPFIYTTYATLHVEGNAFLGSKSFEACDQDAIVCGSADDPDVNGGATAFQGYGTVIAKNFFNHIRRAVYGRVYFNAAVIRENTVFNACGSNLAGGAAIEIDGIRSNGLATGNYFTGNLIEQRHYAYAFKENNSSTNQYVGNSTWDQGGSLTPVASYYFGPQSNDSFVITGQCAPHKVVEDNGLRTQFIHQQSSERSKFVEVGVFDLDVTDKMVFSGGASKNYIQPKSGTFNPNSIMHYVARKADEETDAGKQVYKLFYDGHIWSDAKVLAEDGIGVGNSASATTLGSVVKKMEVFDASGASLGFVPIYGAIT